MFAKTLLSIVGLLFLGNQISTVFACEPSFSADYDCTGCGAGDVGYYFVASQNSLIQVTGENTCNPSGKVQVPGYYKTKSSGIYYKVVHTSYTASPVTSSSAASTNGHIDSDSNGSLVLDSFNHKIAFGATATYLFTDADTVFTSSTTSTVAVKSVGDTIILDNSMNGKDHCVDDNKLIFSTRKGALCDTTAAFTSEDCTAYYNCNQGECTVSPSNLNPRAQKLPKAGNTDNCDVGYYLTVANGSALAETSAGDHHLWYCSNGSTCTDLTDIGAEPLGYLKNSGNPSQFDYIKCTVDGCDILKFTDDETCASAADSTTSKVTTGTLYTNSGDVKLCVYNGGDKSLALSGTPDEGNFFVSIEAALFGLKYKSGNFIVVNIDDQGNAKVVKESSAVRYKYILTGDDKREIHSRATAKTEIEGGKICGSGTPTEFIMNQWDNTSAIDSEKADYYVQES